MRLLAFFLVAIIGFISCKNGSKSGDSTTVCKPLTVMTPDVSISNSDGIAISKVSIDGNCLKVRISYEGCKNYDFDLIHNGKVRKSLPPQVTLVVQMTEKTCETKGKQEKEICYDIDALKAISDDGKVVLSVQGYDEPVIYTY